jgi:hypothetical protein
VEGKKQESVISGSDLLIKNNLIFLGRPATGFEIVLQMVVESLTALFAGANSMELQRNSLPISSFLSIQGQKLHIKEAAVFPFTKSRRL